MGLVPQFYAARISTNALVDKMYPGGHKRPLNARERVYNRLRSLQKKLCSAEATVDHDGGLSIVKNYPLLYRTERRGPFPIEWWVEQ